MRNSFIITLLVSLTSLSQADMPLYQSLKKTWSESSDMETTHERANMSGPILEEGFNTTDRTRYWTGASHFSPKDPDAPTMAQILFDVLLSHPLETYTRQTHPKELLERVYHYNTGSTLSKKAQSYIRDTLRVYTQAGQNEKKTFYEIYHKLHVLSIQSQSCDAFWENSNQMGKRVPVVAVLEQNARGIPENLQECQQAICTTRIDEPFNAFYDISQTAGMLRQTVDSLNCNRAFKNKPAEKSLCEQAKDLVNFSEFPLIDGVTPKLSDGKSYIQKLSTQLNELKRMIEPIVLLQLSEEAIQVALSDKAYEQFLPVSFASLTTPQPFPTLKCDNINHDGHYTACGDPYLPLTPIVDKVIMQLYGLNHDFSALSPGLMLSLNEYENFITLVAGNFVEFMPVASIGGVPSSLNRSKQSISEKRLFLTEDTHQEILAFRQSVTNHFYALRNEKRQHIYQNLLIKSASANISNEIKEQNYKQMRYLNPKGDTELKQAHQTLAESSLWRLQGKEWLESLATLPNIGIWREIVILLAEIKQIQYYLFKNNLSELVLSLFTIVQNNPPSADLIQEMNDGYYRQLAGIPKASNALGEQSIEDIESTERPFY